MAVLKQIEGAEEEVSEVGPGKYFGELGLITEQPRQATVIAMDKVKLAFLDRLSFERLVGPGMDVIKRSCKFLSATDEAFGREQVPNGPKHYRWH